MPVCQRVITCLNSVYFTFLHVFGYVSIFGLLTHNRFPHSHPLNFYWALLQAFSSVSIGISFILTYSHTHTHCARGQYTGWMCTMKGICVMWFNFDPSKKKKAYFTSGKLTPLPPQLYAACLTTSFRLPPLYSLSCLSFGVSLFLPCLSNLLFTSSLIYLGSEKHTMS